MTVDCAFVVMVASSVSRDSTHFASHAGVPIALALLTCRKAGAFVVSATPADHRQ